MPSERDHAGAVRHVGVALRLREDNKKPSPKGGLPLRDGSKFTVAVPAVPLSLSLMRPLCTISEFA